MDYTQQEHPPEKGAAVSNDRATHRMRDDLKAYQDGELPPLRRWWVGQHINNCAACRTEVSVLQRLEWEMKELERAVPRPQLRARILASLPDAPPVTQVVSTRPANRRPAFGTARRPMLAMGSVCAVLLLMVGALALNHWQRVIEPGGNPSLAKAVAPPSSAPLTPDARLTNNSTPDDGGANSATRSTEPAYTPHDPFSPANSSGSPEASTRPLRIASETTGTHLSRQSTSATPLNVATASTTKGEVYTDPTSRAAEELSSRVLPNKLEIERRNASASVLQPARFVQQAARGKNGIAATTQVAFAVADVSEARRQLQKWAEETGAKITAVAARNEGRDAGTETPGSVPVSSGSVSGPNFVEAAQTPTLLKIQVPAQQADLFKSRLGYMGTPLLPQGKAPQRVPYAVVAEDSMTENGVRALAAPAPIDGADKRGDAPRHRDTKATVTIMVRLQACSPLPR